MTAPHSPKAGHPVAAWGRPCPVGTLQPFAPHHCMGGWRGARLASAARLGISGMPPAPRARKQSSVACVWCSAVRSVSMCHVCWWDCEVRLFTASPSLLWLPCRNTLSNHQVSDSQCYRNKNLEKLLHVITLENLLLLRWWWESIWILTFGLWWN